MKNDEFRMKKRATRTLHSTFFIRHSSFNPPCGAGFPARTPGARGNRPRARKPAPHERSINDAADEVLLLRHLLRVERLRVFAGHLKASGGAADGRLHEQLDHLD